MKFYKSFGINILLLCKVLLSTQSCTLPKFGSKLVVSETAESVKDIYAEHIRTSSFQSPEEERLSFKLPPGFEITLFASEPDITKPVNMEFDDRGRLWVTQSSEYPIAAGMGNGKDRITILEDKDGDGKADQFIHFEDNLNIPIGVMPVTDGAIAYSIPNLYYFKDIDEDGKSDGKKVILGEFGHKDTHGMVNNLIRGFDGWLHGCHGFSNISNVAGTDGDTIKMTSGNTFRVRMDGSRVEQTTFGRVNPFGYAYDEKGYLYSVDCHTKPITQLITGGEYPHFGKKEPVGIGFAPEMMSYDLGSTALAGLVYYSGVHFPEKYRKSFFTGDVVTCRIDHSTMTYRGSTPVLRKEEPFLISTDPWFRPVDIKVGPDGSLYVADFYNRIIGHYEVALNHLERDRLSGRIWKITYTGNEPHQNMPVIDYSKASINQLLDALKHPQLSTRLKIADRIVDTWKSKSIDSVRAMMMSKETDIISLVHGLWVLHRLDALDDEILGKFLNHNSSDIKLHVLRILRERTILTDSQYQMVANALSANDPFIKRAAAEIFGKFAMAENLYPLVSLYEKTDPVDSHLRYTVMLAIRDNLRNQSVMWKIPGMKWDNKQLSLISRALLDVPSSSAASFVLDYVVNHELPANELTVYLEYIGRYVSSYQLNNVIDFIRKKLSDKQEAQLKLYKIIDAGIQQSGLEKNPKMSDWGINLAKIFLENISENGESWKAKSIINAGDQSNPWMVSDAFLTTIVPAFRIVLSEKKGYPPRSALYSENFKLPGRLSMNVFDNDIDNSLAKVGLSKNSVKIKLAKDNRTVAEYRLNQKTASQFKDLIKEAIFDLKDHEGQLGYIMTVDSSMSGSIGIGKIEPSVVEIPLKGPGELLEQRVLAAEIGGASQKTELEPILKSLLLSDQVDYELRLASANALMNINPKKNVGVLIHVFENRSELPVMREKLVPLIGQATSESIYEIFKRQLDSGARMLQVAIAMVLSNTSEGISYLLNAFKEEMITDDIADEISVKERFSLYSTPDQQKQMNQILFRGANEREERQKLIDKRIAGFTPSNSLTEAGKVIFTENCSSCHQIQGAGGLVGPQLDGIGNWGLRALSLKILDPNRNVTEAFRTYNITLKNDKSMTGLYRRSEGETMVFADLTGQEFSVSKKEIKDYSASKYTVMPDQFRNTIPENEFYALMEYLLSVK